MRGHIVDPQKEGGFVALVDPTEGVSLECKVFAAEVGTKVAAECRASVAQERGRGIPVSFEQTRKGWDVVGKKVSVATHVGRLGVEAREHGDE